MFIIIEYCTEYCSETVKVYSAHVVWQYCSISCPTYYLILKEAALSTTRQHGHNLQMAQPHGGWAMRKAPLFVYVFERCIAPEVSYPEDVHYSTTVDNYKQ